MTIQPGSALRGAIEARRLARRRRDPVRDARRQHEITRMSRRILDFVPTYRDTLDGPGQIIASTYLGHVAVRAR